MVIGPLQIIFYLDRKFNMATTTKLSFKIGPNGKINNIFFLETTNCTLLVFGWFFIILLFFMSSGNPIWLPTQDIF
jgi:hypothetical protein